MFNPSAMLRAFSPLVDLSVDEVKSALEEVEATVTDPQQKAIFLSMLLGRWAEEDPKAAIVYAEKTVDDGGPMAGQALFTVVGPWARKDPEAAWEWYQKKRESDDFSNGMMGASMYLNAIFSGMASRDLDGAIDRLLQLEDDQDRMMAASGIALSSTDSKARQRFLDRTASLDEETRKTLRQGIVSQWAMMEADKAMDWVRALPAEERSSLLDSVSYSFMMGNPEKGAAFLLEDATEENLPRRYALIVNSWANRNPNAAGEWLNRQPPGPAQDEARGSFAMTVSRRDPESAMEWAKTISDENRRFGSIQMVYMQWAKKDPAAAEAALDAAGLPAERLQSIRQSAASNNNNNNRATPAPTLRRP